MSNTNRNASILNWAARFSSIASFLFVGTFVVGELTSGNGQVPTAAEWIGLAFFPIGLLAGLALGWWKELPGGLVAVLSIAAFYVWDYSRSGTWPGGPYFMVLAVPGVLFILAAVLPKQTAVPKDDLTQTPQTV